MRHTPFVRSGSFAGGCAVDDNIAVLFFPQQTNCLTEPLFVHGSIGIFIAHVQMHNGGAGLPAFVGVFRNFRRSQGNVFVFFLRSHCACERGGNNYFVCVHWDYLHLDRRSG